jgi:hypothetical protein
MEDESMSIPAKCPKCGCSLVGAKIKHQGKATWKEINDSMIRSGMLTGRILPPPGCNLFYTVTVACPACRFRLADILMANSNDPARFAEYRAKASRYKASTALSSEMLTATGGDIQIARKQSDELKSKANISVMYHVGVDQQKVNRLVRQLGSILIAGVDAQIACGRPPQAVIAKDGIRLYACSKASAKAQGVEIEGDYLIVGMPEDCELAKRSDEAIRDHPDSVQIPLDELGE